MEEWREIPGYDGWYECSTEGRVRSWRTPGNNSDSAQPRAREPRVMKPGKTRGSYLSVTLSRSGDLWQVRLNRLVLMTFAGKADPGMQACHRNGDRQDNRLENLYWGTAAQNQADKEGHGTQVRGERVASAKLTRDSVAEIRALWATGRHSILELAERFNVSGPTLWRAATGKTWREDRA